MTPRPLPIDLFRPYVAYGAAHAVAALLTPDTYGRLFIGQGKYVDEFERRFAELVAAPLADACVSTNSCTAALGIALILAGVEHGKGHEVIATPMTCTATSGAIVNAGARIVWADVDPATGLIDPADVARKVTPRTKAIVAVDWGGRACDYDALRDAALVSPSGESVPIIEDAAHALLATHRGASIAAAGGDYVCYSFGPIKHLTCSDGGMLVTHRGDQERARRLRWHGLDRRSSADFRCGHQRIAEPGGKWHLTDYNAVVGLANLPDAAWVVGRHRAHAAWYDRHLAGLPGVTLAPPDPGSAHWCYFLRVEDRDGIRAFERGRSVQHGFTAFMRERNIQTSPVHARNDTHPAYAGAGGPLPGVDAYDATHVAIPVGWWLSDVDLARVAEGVRDWSASWAGAGGR